MENKEEKKEGVCANSCCGGHFGHKKHIIKKIIVLVIIVLAFALGMQIGELKGELRSYLGGSRGMMELRGNGFNYGMMRGYGQVNTWSGASTSTPSAPLAPTTTPASK